jgi:hypothetical protein
MLPPAHQLFWSSALDAEEKFFDTLSKAATPQRMDDLLQHQDNMSKLMGALQDTWTFLLSENEGIKNDEMRAVQDIDKMVQEVITQMDDYWRKVLENSQKVIDAIRREGDYLMTWLRENLGKAVDVLIEMAKKYFIEQDIKPDGTPSEIDDPTKVAIEHLRLMAEAAAESARRYRLLLASYKDFVSRHKDSVLTMFNKTRQDINQYLSSNGIGKARVYLDQGKGELNDWTSALPTSRQKDDGGSFRDDVNQKLDITWQRTQNLDDQFKTKFQGALLSPLSNETIETLAQHYMFKEQIDKIKDRDITKRIDEITEELPEQVIKIDESLRSLGESVSGVSGLPDDVRDLTKSMTKEFQEFLRGRIQSQVTSLLPALDDLKKLMTPSNLDEDLNRKELESMLG